jgi:hypothetical protein
MLTPTWHSPSGVASYKVAEYRGLWRFAGEAREASDFNVPERLGKSCLILGPASSPAVSTTSSRSTWALRLSLSIRTVLSAAPQSARRPSAKAYIQSVASSYDSRLVHLVLEADRFLADLDNRAPVLDDANRHLSRMACFASARIASYVPECDELSGVRVTGPLHRSTHYRGSPVLLSESSLTRLAAS